MPSTRTDIRATLSRNRGRSSRRDGGAISSSTANTDASATNESFVPHSPLRRRSNSAPPRSVGQILFPHAFPSDHTATTSAAGMAGSCDTSGQRGVRSLAHAPSEPIAGESSHIARRSFAGVQESISRWAAKPLADFYSSSLQSTAPAVPPPTLAHSSSYRLNFSSDGVEPVKKFSLKRQFHASNHDSSSMALPLSSTSAAPSSSSSSSSSVVSPPYATGY